MGQNAKNCGLRTGFSSELAQTFLTCLMRSWPVEQERSFTRKKNEYNGKNSAICYNAKSQLNIAAKENQ